MVNLCLRITNSFSQRVPVFLSPTAKVCTTQYTKKEQLRRQQTRDWQLSSGDEDIRNIFISPPDDVRQMLNLDHETVLRLRKAVYGLVNAPKKWWDRLKTSLVEHGFTSCALDPCAFVLGKSGKSMECSVFMLMM